MKNPKPVTMTASEPFYTIHRREPLGSGPYSQLRLSTGYLLPSHRLDEAFAAADTVAEQTISDELTAVSVAFQGSETARKAARLRDKLAKARETADAAHAEAERLMGEFQAAVADDSPFALDLYRQAESASVEARSATATASVIEPLVRDAEAAVAAEKRSLSSAKLAELNAEATAERDAAAVELAAAFAKVQDRLLRVDAIRRMTRPNRGADVYDVGPNWLDIFAPEPVKN